MPGAIKKKKKGKASDWTHDGGLVLEEGKIKTGPRRRKIETSAFAEAV